MEGEAIFDAYISSSYRQLRNHTVRVVHMCNIFANELCLCKKRRKILLNAAWLHDIAKYDNKDNHHKRKYTRYAIKSIDRDYPKKLSAIYRIIKNHKGEFSPDSRYELEVAILRICDKLDRFNKGKRDASKKCKSTLKIIKKQIPNIPTEFLITYKKLLGSLTP